MSNKSEPFIEEWELYAKNPNHGLIEKCLKLAQMLEYPELDISEYVEKINSIGISLQNLLVEKKKSNLPNFNSQRVFIFQIWISR